MFFEVDDRYTTITVESKKNLKADMVNKYNVWRTELLGTLLKYK